MNNFCKYLILFISILSLASAFTARVDSYNQAEIETSHEIEKVPPQIPAIISVQLIFYISSFPHHINLHPQFVVQEFIKPPSFS